MTVVCLLLLSVSACVCSLCAEEPVITTDIIQMTHDGKCDMLIYIYICPEVEIVNTRVKPEC